jgi:hypothetical protein
MAMIRSNIHLEPTLIHIHLYKINDSIKYIYRYLVQNFRLKQTRHVALWPTSFSSEVVCIFPCFIYTLLMFFSFSVVIYVSSNSRVLWILPSLSASLLYKWIVYLNTHTGKKSIKLSSYVSKFILLFAPEKDWIKELVQKNTIEKYQFWLLSITENDLSLSVFNWNIYMYIYNCFSTLCFASIPIHDFDLKSIQQSHQRSELIINHIKSLDHSSTLINNLIVNTYTNLIQGFIILSKNFY